MFSDLRSAEEYLHTTHVIDITSALIQPISRWVSLRIKDQVVNCLAKVMSVQFNHQFQSHNKNPDPAIINHAEVGFPVHKGRPHQGGQAKTRAGHVKYLHDIRIARILRSCSLHRAWARRLLVRWRACRAVCDNLHLPRRSQRPKQRGRRSVLEGVR